MGWGRRCGGLRVLLVRWGLLGLRVRIRLFLGLRVLRVRLGLLGLRGLRVRWVRRVRGLLLRAVLRRMRICRRV